MRLIDADKLQKELLLSRQAHAQNERENQLMERDAVIVQEQPTVDAVEVVRCKNCVHNKQIECPLSYTSEISDYGTVTVYYKNKDDGYCSYGERKDGAE